MENTCTIPNCEICKDSDLLKRVPEDLRAEVSEILTRCYTAEMDSQYWREKFSGTWPGDVKPARRSIWRRIQDLLF